MFFRIFCGFNIGSLDDFNILFKLTKIFDPSEQGNSTCVKESETNISNFAKYF